MRRRTLLQAVAITTGFAGCQAGQRSDTTTSATKSDAATATPVETTRRPSPDEPVSANAAADVVVENETARSRYVTVSVYDGDANVYVEGRTIPPDGRAVYRSVVTADGEYRFVVETEDGDRIDRRFRVTGVRRDLSVRVGESIDAWQPVVCDPDCAPVSRGGTTEPLPYRGESLPLDAPASVHLVNDGNEPRIVTLRARTSDVQVVNYRYRVPPSVRVVVPAFGDLRDVTVSATVDGTTTTTDWQATSGATLAATIGDEVTFDCGGAVGRITVTNLDDATHQLHVSVRSDDSVYRRTVEVDSKETRTVETVSGDGKHRLSVETDEGKSSSLEWFLCDVLERTDVFITPFGTVEISTEPPSPPLEGR